MNNTDVSHRRRAERCLQAVDAARVAVDETYAAGGPDAPARAARLHNEIRLGLKTAEVHASLAIAEAITLNGRITRAALT